MFNFSFEQNSLFSSKNFITKNDEEEYDITRDPFNLIVPNNSFIFDDIHFSFKDENIYELNKDETQEKDVLKNINYPQKKISGRKRKNLLDNNGKYHDKSRNDNILRKINGHFLNFTIKFINEVLKYFNITSNNKNDEFYDINGKYKKLINRTNFSSISNKMISELLTLENNNKFTIKNHNKDLLNKIKNINNEIINKILSKKYIDIFKEVFYLNKKEIIYEGLKLVLPITFEDFLKDIKANEDNLYKMRIEEVIKKYYYQEKFIVKKTKKFQK